MRLFLLLLVVVTVAFAYPRPNPEDNENDSDEEYKMMKDEPMIDDREGPYVDFRDECTPRLDQGGCKCTIKDDYGGESLIEYDDNDDCREKASSDD
uniref:Uncharacterized protein n=1 Tax=Plectus sambesii TaxID=2011161 RepID=A0A914UW87_9BILA